MLFVLAACGDNGPSKDLLVSGTRLRATWLADADGNRIVPPSAHWTDQDLALPCNSDRADDGELRCLPEPGQINTGTPRLFSDAACTIRAQKTIEKTCDAGTDPFDDSFTVSSAADPSSCAGGRHARVTGALPAGQPLFEGDGSGGCVQTDVPDHAIVLGEDVPATTFAHVTETQEGGGRLAVTVRVSDDGAREPAGIFDTELSAPCTPMTFGDDGVLRCLPSIGQAIVFTDSGCVHPVVEATPPSCSMPSPALVQWTAPAGDTRLAKIGAQIATPSGLFFESGFPNPTCMPLPVVDPTKTYLDTSDFAATDLPALQDVAIGSGRIVEHGLADDGGHVVARLVSLHDTVLDEDVSVRRIGDAHTLLMPSGQGTVEFTDPACTQAVIVQEMEPPAFAIEVDDGGTCSAGRIFAVGASTTADELFTTNDTGCVSLGAPAGPVFELGDELPLDTFVELHLEVD